MGSYDSNGNFDAEKLKEELDELEVSYKDIGDDLLIELPDGEEILVSKGTGNVPTDGNTHIKGENVIVSFDSKPTRAGYTFVGWSEDKNSESAEYTEDGVRTIKMPANNSNVKLISKFNLNTAGSAYQKAKAYGAAKGGSGRIMTYDEANALKSRNTNVLFGQNIGATNNFLLYWLGTPYTHYSDVWRVLGDISSFSYRNFGNISNIIGVRPVVEVSKSKVT